jgi:hypothetical protein
MKNRNPTTITNNVEEVTQFKTLQATSLFPTAVE